MSNLVNNRRARRAVQAGAIVAAVSAGYALREVNVSAQTGGTTTTPISREKPVETAATRDAASMQGAFAAVSSAVEPAVVTIRTESTRAPRGGSQAPGGRRAPRVQPFGQGAPGGADPFGGDLQEFFKQFQRNYGFNEQSFNADTWQGSVLRQKWAETKAQLVQQGERRGGGLGSGMIYRADGLIITNAHVVQDASTVVVELADGRRFDKAKVLGRDPRTDIAVVKIDATDLPTVKLGDSDKTRAGDWAIAIGNPFGLDHTLTVGVISATKREGNRLQLGQDSRTDYLQTDASINPGNSGGPLLDIYGSVIGINNAIYSESGGNQGIGFAIPVNTARDVANRIVKDGRVRRAYLGVAIGDLGNNGPAFGLDAEAKGVLIQNTGKPDAPGAKAGLQPGDLVTKFNDATVTTSSVLQGSVGNASVGSDVTLSVLRNGRIIAVTPRLEELKDEKAPVNALEQPREVPALPQGQLSTIPGLKLLNLSPELARRLGTNISRGVVIIEVAPDSPADKIGLQKGDVIDRVAQTPISGAADFGTAVANVLGRQTGVSKKVALYVTRGGEGNFAIVTLD